MEAGCLPRTRLGPWQAQTQAGRVPWEESGQSQLTFWASKIPGWEHSLTPSTAFLHCPKQGESSWGSTGWKDP